MNRSSNTCGSYEDEESIRELCSSNGINYEKLKKGSVKNVKTLEMFFSGYPRICGMEFFPVLQSLTLVGQEIRVLENLSGLVNLVELNVSECMVQKISGLENCTNLKKLFLYDNKIKKIENISNLSKLATLWLNNNYISEIEGLDKLVYLTDLNLADNCISYLGNSLDNNVNLEVLDLSANQLTSFKDLTRLSCLQNLHSLSLKNPVYGPNPLAQLCNYATYLLFHLPDLKRLDTYDVDNKHLKELAEVTVLKKKMYYNMRVKTLQRNTADLQSRLGQERDELQSFANSRIYKLYSNFKEIEREQEDIRTTPAVLDKQDKEEKDEIKDEEKEETKESLLNENTRQCENKKQALLGRIEKWDKQNREIEACYEESCEQVQLVSDMTIQRLIVELETGGNVRFEDGKPTDLWYKSCHDLVTSRFCAGDYMKHGITGIKIHRITRVHNRILRTRFDEALDEKLDNDDIANVTKGRSHKKLLEYLFFVWNPNILDGANEPIRVLEKGFRKYHEYENAGQDGGVPMSNSIGVGDESRIQHCIKKWKERGSTNPCPFRHGQLIISKVFVGKTVAANVGEKRVTKSKYPGVDSVYRPRSHDDCEAKTILGITRPVKPCDCTSRQCAWFVFDESMVLPEYVVDFEYITKVKSKSQYIHYPVDTIAHQGNEGKDVDDDVLSIEPKPKIRPRMIALTEDLILNHCNADSLQNITVLNLHGNGLTRLKYINTITSLKKLIVSFNEIAKLEEINHMLFLEYIDVSFNKLTTLEGMKGCNRLKYLDISWNKLKFTREELGHMRKHMISLTTLDTRNNPWQKPETLRTRALGRLKNLEILDGKPVTSEEVATSLRMAAASRISTFAILAHSRTDQVKPHSLSLFPTAQTILATSNHKPTRPMDDDNLWMSKVTTLNLDNLHLGKISNLDKLINLRWASLNNNDLTKIEGFDSCSLLQELSLEGNCISKFEGLTKNSKLKWLNLRNNNVSNLDTGMLERLPQLHHLSIENNCIKSLRGLQNSLELQELYIGNNEISNVREIFTLKIISTLVILDLCGNPLVNNTANYRLFVIYHLTTLKALDGLAVEPSEGGLAKDTFGGRMTTDFIAERLGHSNFMELRELDFPNCSLRTVDLGSGELFLTLRSVNLEQNSLTSFGGLINLVNLKVLCLNHNHIETVVAKSKSFSPANASKRGADKETDFTNPESYTPVLLNLEVLHLGYNGISSLATLQLSRLPNLKALFLQGNEITKVEGLEGLRELRELVLDRNKIKCLHDYSFVNQWNLVELHMEENRLRSLSYIECLQNLQRLYIGMNRIQDFNELEKLEPLSNLMELSVINNTVTRRLLHRPTLVFRMPGLLCIDGIPVSNEERTKAEVYFLEQQGGMQSNGATESSLPGIPTTTRQTHAPLRVTTMHLSNSTWNAASRQEFVNSYVNGDSRDSNNKGRRAGNNRGAASNSQHNLSSSDSFHSDRRSHSNSNVPTSQTFSRNSGTVSYIPHGFSYPTYPFSNEERNKGNQRHR